MTKYSHGIIDATWQGSLTIAEGSDQFMWWAHEKSKVVEGGKIKGLNIMTGFTNSQKFSWMNNLMIELVINGSVSSMKFKATGYEWK
jgi:Leu/Phe-tRNA-protein transferase